MRIAITGGIGSGKSYVCALLRQRGIDVYDCDSGAKRLMHSSESLRIALVQLIGNDAYTDGRLNKAAVVKFLLASEDNKQAVNRIVHPAVIQDFYDSGMQWMESAILYEAHLEHCVDSVVCVTAPESVRVERVMARDGIRSERAKEWIDHQMPQEEAARRADFLIVNDGLTDLNKQIDGILSSLQIK